MVEYMLSLLKNIRTDRTFKGTLIFSASEIFINRKNYSTSRAKV